MEILTTVQAARIAGVHDDTVRRWCESGQVYSKKIGNAWAIPRIVLDEFLLKRVEPVVKNHEPKSLYTSETTILRDRPLVSQKIIAKNRKKMQELIDRVMIERQGKNEIK